MARKKKKNKPENIEKKEYIIEEVPAVEIIDGEEVFNIGADLASADWLAYGRLKEAGKLDEAKKMEETKLYRIKRKDGSYL